MPRFPTLALAGLLAVFAAPASADDAAEFMERFAGKWLGTGSLLFGPENGLEFTCELEGKPSRSQLTFGMKGRCWMGIISGPVFARLHYNSDQNRFYGQFLDGAEGDGLDIVGTKKGEGFSLDLVRGQAQGNLHAEAIGEHQMKVLITYRDRANDRYLPIAAMGFTRMNAASLEQPGRPTGPLARSD